MSYELGAVGRRSAEAPDDAIDILRALREDVSARLVRAEEALGSAAQGARLDELDTAFTLDVRMRDEVFFEACARHMDRRQANRFFRNDLDDHAQARLLLWRLRRDGADPKESAHLLGRLRELFGQQVLRDEERVFPMARALLDPIERMRLGALLILRARIVRA